MVCCFPFQSIDVCVAVVIGVDQRTPQFNTHSTWRDYKIIFKSHWSSRNKLNRRLLLLLLFIWRFFSQAKIVWAIFKRYISIFVAALMNWIWMWIGYRWVWWDLLFVARLNFYYPYSEGFLGIFHGHSAVWFLFLFTRFCNMKNDVRLKSVDH